MRHIGIGGLTSSDRHVRARHRLRRWVTRSAVVTVVAASLGPALARSDRAEAATPAATTVVQINPETRYQTIQGWGTSLAWWAEGAGGWSSTSAKNALADALFSPTNGLGLNVVRYNIGATTPTDTCAAQMRVGGAIPSFEQSSGTYDWTQDPNQRWMLQAAQARGANVFDAVAYSAPAWMTENDCSAGANTAGADNLSSSEYGAYAQYLATVVAHFRNSWNIPITTVDPFNEPVQTKWSSTTDQQGMNLSTTAQNTIIGDLQSQLSSNGLSGQVGISAPDEFSSSGTVSDFDSYGAASQADVAQLNTHDYAGGDGTPLYQLGQQTGKRVWMSEWGTGTQSSQIASALELSHQILTNEQQMHPSAWVAWQGVDGPENGGNIDDLWGLVWADISPSGTGQLTFPKRYYAMGNYSEFVRPGYQMIASDDANTFAAYDPSGDKLVIVATNPNSGSESVDYDLTHFSIASGTSAAGYQTSASENLASLPATPASGGLSVTLPAQSVTTYVIPNVTAAGRAGSSVVTSGSQTRAFGVDGAGTAYSDAHTPGASWSGWSSLGGDLADDPTAVGYGADVDAFGRAANGATEQDVYTPGSGWSSWNSIGGDLAGDPVPIDYDTQQNGDQLQVYGRAPDGSVSYASYTADSGWSAWSSLGGDLVANPSVVQYGDQVELYGRAANGATESDVYTPGSGWSSWSSLGGNLVGGPSAIQYGNQMELYGRASDGSTWADVYTPGSGWSSWSSLGGVLAGDPVPVIYDSQQYGEQLELYGRASGGATWSTVYTPGSGWSSWYSMGGSVTDDPTAIQYGDQLQVYGRASDGSTWYDVYTPGSGWSSWTSLGGDLQP